MTLDTTIMLPAQKERPIVAELQSKGETIELIETEKSQWLILSRSSYYPVLLYPVDDQA